MKKFEMTERENLINELINAVQMTVGSWTPEDQKKFVEFAESYISDWYGREHNLTSEEITEIADMCIDYFAEEKTKIYEIRRDIKNGDSFNEWSFDLDKAQQKAKSIRAHLTASENANSDVYIIGYEITCSSKFYAAEDLYTACFNDDINVPEFDSLTGGFTDESQFYFEKVEA